MLFFFDPVNTSTNTNATTHEQLYYGGQIPGTAYGERMTWFNNPQTYEDQSATRPFFIRNEIETLKIYRLGMECLEKCFTIERMIIGRCLPAPYRKDVGKTTNMYVAQMDSDLWRYFVSRHTDTPKKKTYTQGYPDHGGRRPVEFERISWGPGRHPSLHTPYWYLSKWEEEGHIYKAYVSEVSLIRNAWSGMVRAEFNYETWFYNPERSCWQFC